MQVWIKGNNQPSTNEGVEPFTLLFLAQRLTRRPLYEVATKNDVRKISSAVTGWPTANGAFASAGSTMTHSPSYR